jgi:hypothetical protein
MEVCGQGIKVIICRDVREVLPVHFPPMTHAQTLEFIKGGVQRLRERCAQQQAADLPIVGCPVLTHRY